MDEASRHAAAIATPEAGFEAQLQRREAEGDQTAKIHRLRKALPWSIDTLGPATTEPGRLARIESDIAGRSTLPNFHKGGAGVVPLKWTCGIKAVTDVFLAALAAGNAMGWKHFLDAYQHVWEEVARAAAIPTEELPNSNFKAAVDEIDRRLSASLPGTSWQPKPANWQTSFPELHQSHQVAIGVHGAACVDAWHQAFASGRILVFRHNGAHWEFRPPHLFSETPPFPCVGLDDIDRMMVRAQAEALRAEIAEHEARIAARKQRREEGRETIEDMLSRSFEGVALALDSLCLTVSALDSLEMPDRDDLSYAFLLSIQLGHADQPESAAPAKAVKKGRPPYPEDEPLVADLVARVNRGEFDAAETAVSWRLKNRERWLDHCNNSKDESVRKRLIRRVKEALDTKASDCSRT